MRINKTAANNILSSENASIDDAYKSASDKLKDRILLELSNTGDGIAIISDDFQYIYYKGVKWEIEKYEDPDFSGTDAGFSQPFKDIETVYLEGKVLIDWAQLLAGLSLSDSGANTNGRGSGVIRSANAGMELGESVLEALKKSWVKLVFSNNGTDNHVTILGGSKDQTLDDQKSLRFIVNPFTNEVVQPFGKLVDKKVNESDDFCNSIFFNMTGRNLNPNVDYTLYCIRDKDRYYTATPHNYYDKLYFDEEGNLMSVPYTWPNDKYEIRGNDGSVFACGCVPQTPVKASDMYSTLLNPLQVR